MITIKISTPKTIAARSPTAISPPPPGGDNRRQLDIVGETGGSSLLEMNDDMCTTTAIPSNIPTNQLSTRNNRRLHLFASIGMKQ